MGTTHYYGDGCPEHNRCQDWNTEPGVIYHAHDLPPCGDDGVRIVDGRWCCERHAQLREAGRDRGWVTAEDQQRDTMPGGRAGGDST